MKKFLSWAAPALMASMLFVGCQKSLESVSEDGLREGTSRLNGECATCYIDGESTITQETKFDDITPGSSPNTQKITSTVYNTLAGKFVVEVISQRTGGNTNNAPLITAYADLNGDSDFDDLGESQTWIATAPNTLNPSTHTFEFDLPVGFDACDIVKYRVTSLGIDAPNVAETSGDYSLWQVCGCDESFSYEAAAPPASGQDGGWLFTYVPDFTGSAFIEFTVPQGVVFTGLDGFTQPGNGNGQVYQKTIQVTKCVPITWTVKFDGTNNCSSGKSNVWTDFKVNGVTKKGDLDNIVHTCP